MEWSGVEWSGAEWNGVDWNEADWESVFGSLFGAPPSPAWSPAWRWIIRRECGSLLYILYTVYAQYIYILTIYGLWCGERQCNTPSHLTCQTCTSNSETLQRSKPCISISPCIEPQANMGRPRQRIHCKHVPTVKAQKLMIAA